MPYIGAGIQRFNTADGLTVNGNAEVTGTTALTGNATAAGTLDVTGAITSSAGATITTADNTSQLTLKSTDADSSVGPVLDLVRDSASPADGDAIGQIKHTADNDAGEATTYASSFVTLRDASDGAEDSQSIHYLMTNGSLVDHLRMGRGSAGGQSEVVINEGSADIDFRVESDGNANMLFVDGGTNRVGIATNSPEVEAHIKTSSGNPELRIESTGANYASMNLKNSSISYSTQIRTDQSNAYTIRDETNGANRFLLNTSGNIAIGTTHLGSRLNVGDNMRVNTTQAIGPAIIEAQSTASGTGAIGVLNSAGTSGFFSLIMFANASNTAIIGSIQKVNDASVQYNTTSDARLKENISDMTGAITRVKQLAPKRYSWVNEELDAADQDGFLAHEAQTVVPGAVSGTRDEVDDDGNPVHMQMDYSKLVPLLTGALKEAITKIETLETEMTALKARVTALEDA